MISNLLIIGIFVGIVVVVVIAVRQPKKNKERLKQIVEEWNFSFRDKIEVEPYAKFNHPLFSGGKKGLSLTASNAWAFDCIEGNKYGFNWEIFTYRFIQNPAIKFKTASGNEYELFRNNDRSKRNLYQQTIFLVDTGKILPSFAIEKSGIMARFNPVAIKRNIKFSDDPKFTKEFIIEGENSDEINQFFNPELKDYLRKNKVRYIIVTNGSKAIFFRRGLDFNPDEYEKEMQKILEIIKLFK